jgi:hypothetical protein
VTHQKNILRQKDTFEPFIYSEQGMAKVSPKRTTNQGTLCFVKSLPWLGIEIHGSKKSFYLNTFLSFYHNIVCKKCLV